VIKIRYHSRDKKRKSWTKTWTGKLRLLTYAYIMFLHVQQTILATALITAPSVLAIALWALASQFLLALINIWIITKHKASHPLLSEYHARKIRMFTNLDS